MYQLCCSYIFTEACLFILSSKIRLLRTHRSSDKGMELCRAERSTISHWAKFTVQIWQTVNEDPGWRLFGCGLHGTEWATVKSSLIMAHTSDYVSPTNTHIDQLLKLYNHYLRAVFTRWTNLYFLFVDAISTISAYLTKIGDQSSNFFQIQIMCGRLVLVLVCSGKKREYQKHCYFMLLRNHCWMCIKNVFSNNQMLSKMLAGFWDSQMSM